MQRSSVSNKSKAIFNFLMCCVANWFIHINQGHCSRSSDSVINTIVRLIVQCIRWNLLMVWITDQTRNKKIIVRAKIIQDQNYFGWLKKTVRSVTNLLSRPWLSVSKNRMKLSDLISCLFNPNGIMSNSITRSKRRETTNLTWTTTLSLKTYYRHLVRFVSP